MKRPIALELKRGRKGFRFASKANSMVEYLLPVVLVSTLVLVWAFGAGRNMQQAIPGFFPGKADNTNARQVDLKTMGALPTRSISITLDNGKSITVDNLPSDLAMLIETNGADGTTEQLLAALNQLIAKLEAENALPASEIALLKALSNDGHQLGNLQGILSDKAYACGTDNQCMLQAFNMSDARSPYGYVNAELGLNSKIDIANDPVAQGRYQAVTARQVEALRELYPHLDVDLHLGTNAANANDVVMGASLRNFVDRYAQFQDSQHGQNVALTKLVGYLSRNITQLSQVSAAVSYNLASYPDNANPTMLSGKVAEEVDVRNQMNPSPVIHTSSGKICDLGKGQSAQNQCL